MRILLAFTVCSLIAQLTAQVKLPTNAGIEVRTKIGFLLPHRSVMHHLVQGHSVSTELSAVIQSDGSKEWHQVFNYPRYGLTTFYADFGFQDVLGQGVGAYLFGELPLFRNKGWSLSTKLGGGLAYVSKTFDQQSNPKNNSIGSHLNSVIALGASFNKWVNQRWEWSLGMDMTHLSNGASKMPNLGLNMPYLSLGCTYYLTKLTFSETDIDPKVIDPSWSLQLVGIGSTRQVYPTGGRNYPIAALGIYGNKQFKRKAAMDVGLDIMYNGALRTFSEGKNTWSEAMQLGLYVGYVLPVERFSFTAGMGVYAWDQLNVHGIFYHRFGARYDLTEKWGVNMTIKAHWGKADYFEYGLIYTLF